MHAPTACANWPPLLPNGETKGLPAKKEKGYLKILLTGFQVAFNLVLNRGSDTGIRQNRYTGNIGFENSTHSFCNFVLPENIVN